MAEDTELYERIMREFGQMQNQRSLFANQWNEVAELILPTSRNTFYYGDFNWPGQKKTQQQIDATGMMALSRFGAICDSLLTPRNMKWHGLASTDPYLNRRRDVRGYFEEVTDVLFRYRYNPLANFASQNLNVYQSLGAFGTGSNFIDELDYRYGMGLRYKALPLGETFFRENHQGILDSCVRWFRWTARQANQYAQLTAKSVYPFTFPEALMEPLKQGSETLFDFLHYIAPRNDYERGRIDSKGMMWESAYISVQGQCVCQKGGYQTFPYAATRYDQTPGEVYGRSPAMQVLPALKTLNAEKTTFLKVGHRIADPVLLTADDGLMSFNMRPGAVNSGAVNADGKPLVHTLPIGNLQTSLEMMQEEKGLIQDAFLVSLFKILDDNPQMTATEVIERVNEKGILLAPTVGRQQSEYLGPLIHRELDLLSQMDLLPEMPGILQEAGAEYEVVYTSPMARAMKAQEAGGFARVLQILTEAVNVTQDPSVFDFIDFDTALPEFADIQGMPVRWTATPEAIMAKRKSRADAAARQEAIQAAPAAAAMAKVQAENGAPA